MLEINGLGGHTEGDDSSSPDPVTPPPERAMERQLTDVEQAAARLLAAEAITATPHGGEAALKLESPNSPGPYQARAQAVFDDGAWGTPTAKGRQTT
jgi:hypothetical protein